VADFDSFDAKPLGSIPDPLRPPKVAPQTVGAPTERSLTRAERRVRVGLGLAVTFGWVGSILAILGPGKTVADVFFFVPMALVVLSAVVSGFLLFRPDARGLPRSVAVVRLIVLALPLLFLILSLGPSIHAPPEVFAWGPALRCMVEATGIALVPLLIAAALFRRTSPSAAGWRGAAIGALFGLSGAFVIHSACSALGAAHVLVSHAVTIFLGAVLGAALGARGGRI